MRKSTFRTTVLFSALVFLILSVTLLLACGVMVFLYHAGILREGHRPMPILAFLFISILLGILFSRVFGKRPIHLIEEFSDATREIARGNFNLQVNEDVPAAEFRTMAHNFNLMARELSHTEMLRNDFVENVSHEFKTPLAAIEGYAILLQKKDLSEEKRQEYTYKILHNTRRLSTLTGNILLLSRLENSEMEIKKESYSLDEQLREVILLLEEKWTEKNIQMEIELDDVTILGNEGLLAHVWQNLLDNAIKFVSDSGTIRIVLHKRAGQAGATFADNGIGMNKEELERIYEKFYQADSSRTTSGNGLGLTLVRRIIDLHHGTIDVKSVPHEGTQFVVTLPLPSNEEKPFIPEKNRPVQ